MKPTFLKVGVPHSKVRPPTTVRPPTQPGAAPTLEAGDWQTFNAGVSTVEANYPTGVSGDMIVLCGYESVGGSFTTPTGFTEVFYDFEGTDGIALWAKISDGTESGSVSIPTAGANAVVNTNRILANGATLSIAAIVANTGTDTNPPAVTLVSSEYVVLAGLLFDGTDAVVNGPPTGYTTGVVGRFGSDIFGGVAQKLVSGPGTEDPAAWDLSVTISTASMSFTAAIAIDPSGASVSEADHTHVEADVTDLAHTDADAIHDNVASEISAITAKGSPTSSDFLLIEDAADSNNKKSITIGDLPTGATDHGALTGLTDDDHTQYLLAAGTRAATYLEVSGLTGATASSPRFVGGTTSGAPASGTFALGDYVVTEDGNIYVCTTAGSPGSWTAVGAGAATDSDAIHDNVASEISAITEKTTLADADLFIIEDSAASNVKKRVQWSNVKGGGGGSISRVGRTTAGASWLAPSSNKYARKVTSLVSGDVVLSIGIYLRSTLANVAGAYAVGIFDDDTSGTSQPGTLLAVGSGVASADDLLFENNTERWFYAPLGAYIPATDNYWIAFWFQDPNNMQIAYDTTGGTAAQLSAGGGWWSEFGATGHSFTSQVYDISMHAVVLS